MSGKRKLNATNYRRIYFERCNLTQKEYVIDYMKRYGSITCDEAFEAFDCRRLAAVIYQLRKDFNIVSVKCGKSGIAVYQFGEK